MKKSLIFMAMVLGLIFSMGLLGCNESDADRVAGKIDGVYKTVRSVITDPDIFKAIPTDKVEKLAALEQDYLGARESYQASKKTQAGGDWSMLREMVSYGSGLVTILEQLPQVGEHKTEIDAARVVVRALIAAFG